jgi:Uma2 family endonuclease
MSAVLIEDAEVETLADVLERLGGIPADRVLLHPTPGTATEADLLRLPHDIQKLCELVDGTLVRKPMGAPESAMAMWLVAMLGQIPGIWRTAVLLGPDGHTRYFRGHVRMPDVAVIYRNRLPDGKLPPDAICNYPPDLAVEVLSKSNTRREIEKKLETFFESGVRLAWVANPRKRTVRVHRSAADFRELKDGDTLSGEDVLPGFTLSVTEWFDAAE